MRLFKFCIVVVALVLIVSGGRADEERASVAPVRLIVKAISIGKIAPDIFEERRYGCMEFARPGMVSPDLTHVAQLVKRGKRVAVVVDGVASPLYDDPQRMPFCYRPVFSDDSRHYAFIVWRGNRLVVVLDGVEIQSYSDSYVDSLTFGPQNNRLAYRVFQKSDHGYKCNLIVDGVSLITYDEVSAPLFSRDGTHMSYVAWQGKEDFLVKDGVPGKHYNGSICLLASSPDGRRIAYQVDREQKKMVVVNEAEEHEYDDTSRPQYSPDSLHVAYLARHGSVVSLVVDGIEGTPYVEKAESLLNRWIYFSPDSKHVAYLSATGRSGRLIVDGVEQREYPGSIGNFLLFSPDGKRLAFYAGARQHIVSLDFGREASSRIVADDVVDTRISGHLCYHLPTMFIPHSGRPSYGLTGYGLLEEHAIVVDGAGKSWLYEPKKNGEVSRLLGKFEADWVHTYSSNRLAFLTVRKHELFRVEVEIVYF